jgi:putative transposase
MHVAAKIRIQVTPEQEDVLWHLSEKCRLIYNFALAERNRNNRRTRIGPTSSTSDICSRPTLSPS